MNLFLWLLFVDALAVCCGVCLFYLYRERQKRKAAARRAALPSESPSKTECVGGSLAFRPQSCALNFPLGKRSRVLIEGDADLSGLQEFTVNLVLGLHDTEDGDAVSGVLCDVDGVLSIVASGGCIGFRVCQIAPLESDGYAWSPPLAPGRWYLVSCVFSHGTSTVYVDGVALAKSTVRSSTPYCGPIRALQLGADEAAVLPGQFFCGAIAHVEVWRRAFSRSDVANLQLLSSATCPPASTGDVAMLYSLEHSDAHMVCDESGNGYHGEMDVQAPEWVLIECNRPASPPAPRREKHRASSPPVVRGASPPSSPSASASSLTCAVEAYRTADPSSLRRRADGPRCSAAST